MCMQSALLCTWKLLGFSRAKPGRAGLQINCPARGTGHRRKAPACGRRVVLSRGFQKAHLRACIISVPGLGTVQASQHKGVHPVGVVAIVAGVQAPVRLVLPARGGPLCRQQVQWGCSLRAGTAEDGGGRGCSSGEAAFAACGWSHAWLFSFGETR